MNFKRILTLGAVATIACGTPATYAGYPRAIRAYQRAHNLRIDGAISDQLLGRMGLRY